MDNISASEEAVNKLLPILKETDTILNDWTGDSCLQFPVLMQTLAFKLNWDEKVLRENDPLIRWYVRNHPNWYVTRGAHGGIMRKEAKLKKDSLKNLKAKAKEEMKAEILSKIDSLVLKTSKKENSNDFDDLELSEKNQSLEDEDSLFTDFS